jgi:hypothetical protein
MFTPRRSDATSGSTETRPAPGTVMVLFIGQS